MSPNIRAALAGSYVLEREIDRGSTAVVYAARDLKHGRRVALKVIGSDVSSALGRTRFVQEIRTTAALNHPHILPLFDSGDAAGFLFYTMPLVEGESLRGRIDGEGRLPLDVALALIRQMCDALAYAHEAGIVHRDLKPENILIAGHDHVWIADFGLARALASATDHRLTGTGTAIGSPHYMSPEQASGEDDIDARADVYSLACVAFEMLCGETPFTAGSVPALLARHISEPAPSIRDRCDDIPVAIDAALRRAMSKDRSHRFNDVAAFCDALHVSGDLAAAAPPEAIRPRTRLRLGRRRVGIAAAGAAAFIAITAFVLSRELPGSLAWWRDPPLDAQLFMLYPLASAAGGLDHDHTALLHDALRTWQGLRVVEAAARDVDGDPAVVDPESAFGAARNAGAGRLITGRLITGRLLPESNGADAGDAAAVPSGSVRVDIRLYDTAQPAVPIRHVSTRLPAEGSAEAYRTLAGELLFGSDALTREAADGTSSYEAMQLFGSAARDVMTWRLQQADSALAAAVEVDAGFVHGWLWLAQVRVWRTRPEAEWRYAAEHARRAADRLSAQDSRRVGALIARAEGRIIESCESYRGMTRHDGNDFGAWLGLGHCLRYDSVVVADPTSLSRWRFRINYSEILAAYQTALRVQPSLHGALRSRSSDGLQAVLHTRRHQLRTGRAVAPDTLTFRAYPMWQHDSVAFIPFPSNLTTPAWLDSTAIDRAVYRQRRLLYDMATTWRVANRDNPEALEVVAVALDLLGDRAAFDTLRKARPLARSMQERTRIATSEVWLQLKYAIPDDTMAIASARELADSLLRDAAVTDADPATLSGVAAVIGRINESVRLARHPRLLDATRLPPGTAAPVVSLFRFAAAAAPPDSIRRYQRIVDGMLDRIDPETRAAILRNWYARSAGLALQTYRFDDFSSIPPVNPLIRAHSAFVRGDTVGVRTQLATVAALRRERGVAARDITLDALVQEAWLLLRIGDADAAMNLLRPTLDALSQMPLDLLTLDGMASALVRAVMLRAEAGRATGDARDAARWAAAAHTLLARRDPALDTLLADAASTRRGR